MLIGKAIRLFGYCIATVIILAATAVSTTQLLSPYLNEHRTEISSWVSNLLNVPIAIQQVSISWRQIRPELVLSEVSVLNKQTQKPRFKIQKIKINLRVIESILQQKLLPEDIRIYGVHLILRQEKSGQLHVEGLDQFVFTDNFTGDSVAGNAMRAWVFSQPFLGLRNIQIDYVPAVGPKKYLTLSRLNLSNTTTQHEAKFSQLSLSAWQKFPGINNIDGEISWDGKQGTLILNSRDATITLDSIFEKPLQFKTISGNLKWQKNAEDAWVVAVKNFQLYNADISINTNMTLVFAKDESPLLDLSGEFSVPHVAKIENYLPLKKLEAPFVAWVHNRFQGGQLVSGTMIAQGKLDDFPFENGPGKFLVTAKVKDLEFDYAPGWPMVHHVYGNLVFSGHSMTADADSGQLFDASITKAHGYIPYIGPNHPQILDLTATMRGDLRQGLRFIQESPLRNTIGKDLSGAQLSGKLGLKLAFTIPVKTPELTKVLGDADISAGELQLPSWNLTLDQISGLLHFTEQSIQTTQMHGQLFNEAVILDIDTVRPSNANISPVVKAKIQSKISQLSLEKWLNIPLSQFMKGETSYQAELDLTSHRFSEPSQLVIQSDLKGVSINLPEQYAKNAEESRDFKLLAKLKQDQPIQIKITYGTLLSAALTYEWAAQHWQLKGGELQLGNKGQADWQSQPGILISGNVDKLDWNMWRTYFTSLSPTNSNNLMEWDSSLMRYFRGIDIQANQFPIWGQVLTNVRVRASKENMNWKIDVTSPEMTGQVWLPISGSTSMIRATFQHLYLTTTENQKSIDPKTLPAISLTSDDVRFKDKAIGRVALDMSPNKTGVQIKKLNISTNFYNLNATGRWSSQHNRNQTSLDGVLDTQNVSQLLDYWKLGSANLVAGDGHMTFNLQWLDTPYNPSLSTLSGELFLKLGKGRVINLGNSTDAKMGFGRMLNVLSLQTLPRRLSLDFTDLFEKGYSFDVMQGHFNLDRGKANTKDTYFDGPIAKIEINGMIGLAAKNYDLSLSVTPYVTGSIPVVATLAGGPLVGAATWLVEKVAGSVVSKVATYRYSVTGPWDNPVWQQTK